MHTINAILPISKLNDDILSHIFMFNTQLDLNQVHVPSTTIRRASQVYQRWRNLLLNYPLIWAASLDLADPKAWTQVVLARAGEVPLTVTLPSLSRAIVAEDENRRARLHNKYLHGFELTHYYDFGPSDEQLDVAISLLQRSRRFTITIYSEEQSRLIANKVDISVAPHLKELTISVPQKHGFLIRTGVFDDCTKRPQVEKLDLRGFGVDIHLLSSPVFQSLTTLAVSHLKSPAVASKPRIWLKVLSHLPRLKTLVLRGCFDIGSEDVTVSNDTSPETLTHPISLSRLHTLVLSGICNSCQEILSQLHFPSSCGIDIDVYLPLPDNKLHSSAMMSELSNKVRSSLQPRKITALSVEASWCLFKVTTTRYAQPGDAVFTITLTMLWSIEEILPEFLRLISTDVTDLHIRYLKLGPGGFLKPKLSLRDFLEPFQQVTNLRLAGKEALDNITDLHIESMASSTSGSGQLLPHLSRLSLYMVPVVTEELVDVMIDFLHHRLKVDAPITDVLLRSCHGSEVVTLVTSLEFRDVEVDQWDCHWETELDPEVEEDSFFPRFL